MIKKIILILLSLSIVLSLSACEATGISEKPIDNNQEESLTEETSATVKVAYSEDKIYQTYNREVDGIVDQKLLYQGEQYMSDLSDSFEISVFKNETESRQLIITALNRDITDYKIEVNAFTSGQNSISKNCFSIGHEYYHNLTTVMDPETPMSSGMIPDAVIPFDAAVENKINNIKAHNNQGVLITVNIPKEQKEGEYNGSFTLTLNEKIITVDAKITVLDYTLPDEVVARSCLVIDGVPEDELSVFELDCSQEMYWKYVEKLSEFGLSTQYMYGLNISADSLEEVEVLAEEHVKYMILATENSRINTYSIRTNGKAVILDGQTKVTTILNEDYFMTYGKKMVEASLKEGVDLFKKATVYMGSIIDEPEDTVGMNIVDYVCEQFHDCLRNLVEYVEEIKDGAIEKAQNVDQEFIEQLESNIINVTNIVTTSAPPETYEQVDTYCPKIATPNGKYAEPVGSSARLEDYAELKNEQTSTGRVKDYWWYTHQTPFYPNPTLHIDDNGVSARVMYWMMSKYNVQGYLLWETVVSNGNYGWDLYNEIIRDNVSSGDAFMFYPGKLLNIDGPVPSIRLYYMRDGIEEYDAMYDLRNGLTEKLSERYGTQINFDGILNELYSNLFSLNKTYASSIHLEDTRKLLENIMVLANHDIAIDGFEIGADGKVSVNIYTPTDKVVKINGEQLTSGTACQNGIKYVVNGKFDNFELEIDGLKIAVLSDTEISEMKDGSKLTVYKDDGERTVKTTSYTKTVLDDGIKILIEDDMVRVDYSLANGFISEDCSSVIVSLEYDGAEKQELSVDVMGENINGRLDTFYIHQGENIFRINRIGDLNWNTLEAIKKISFVFESGHTEFNLTIKSITVIK